MNPIINIALLIICFNVAWAFTKIYNFFEKSYNCYKLKKHKFDDLYKKRCKKLHDNRFDYYYTLAINNPFELCYELASKDLNRLKKQGRIIEMYSKLRECV